jgi:hypothetical protein
LVRATACRLRKDASAAQRPIAEKEGRFEGTALGLAYVQKTQPSETIHTLFQQITRVKKGAAKAAALKVIVGMGPSGNPD